MLKSSNAGTGFMHESFNKDDANNFTRKWFAWANTIFGEFIFKLINYTRNYWPDNRVKSVTKLRDFIIIYFLIPPINPAKLFWHRQISMEVLG